MRKAICTNKIGETKKYGIDSKPIEVHGSFCISIICKRKILSTYGNYKNLCFNVLNSGQFNIPFRYLHSRKRVLLKKLIKLTRNTRKSILFLNCLIHIFYFLLYTRKIKLNYEMKWEFLNYILFLLNIVEI